MGALAGRGVVNLMNTKAAQLVDQLLEDSAQDKEDRLWSKAVAAARLEPESLKGKVVRVDLDDRYFGMKSITSESEVYAATATVTSAGGTAQIVKEIELSVDTNCQRNCKVGPLADAVADAAGITGFYDRIILRVYLEDAITDAIDADDDRAIIVHCLTGKIESQIEGEAV